MLELALCVFCIGILKMKPDEIKKDEVREVTKEEYFHEMGWDK